MPFCPECEIEYREGFTTCSDCEVDLVATLETAEPEPGQPVHMVEVGKIADPGAAGMVRETLKEQGIECALTGEETEGMMPGMVNPTHEIGIMVPEENIEKAKEIIEAYFCETEGCKEPEFMVCSNCECPVDDTNDVCPACGEKLEEG